MSTRIKQVSTETENAMLRKSAFGLPNRPSELGMKAEDIKKAFYKSLIDSENSLLSELKRVVSEANAILSEIDNYASGHSSNKSNPHSVTKSQVGLGNVDNTSDDYVFPWLEVVKEIAPRQVMIYTIDRETPAPDLLKATHEELDRIGYAIWFKHSQFLCQWQ